LSPTTAQPRRRATGSATSLDQGCSERQENKVNFPKNVALVGAALVLLEQADRE
jgi:hypothetical protein